MTLLLFCGFSPQARAQEGNVILAIRKVSVGVALEEINRQTGYTIVTTGNQIDRERMVLFSSNQLSVSELLTQALSETGAVWRVEGNRLTITATSDTPATHPGEVFMDIHTLGGNNITVEEFQRIRNGYRGGNTSGSDSLGLATLSFRVNSTRLESDYMNNRAALQTMDRVFSDKELQSEMDFMIITGAASPEGYTPNNDKLAAGRAMAVKSYIAGKYPFMESGRIFTCSIGEDWTGLRKMVEDDPGTPFRHDILRIIDTHPQSATRWSMFKALGDGAAYRYLLANMLPRLRDAAVCMIFYKGGFVASETVTQVDTVYVERLKETIVEIPVAEERASQKIPYYLAIKTNLLYDLALLPDLALEFTLPGRWSVEVGGQWSWWNTPTNHKNCWRIQVAGLEVRKWLGNKERTPLTGHFVGLYGMGGTYDVRFNDKTGYLSDWSYSAGLSYGYSLPIGRRFNLEFGIAGGYVGGAYKTYDVYNKEYDVFPKKADKRLRYVGPTKAEISLVWLIGGGKNEPKRK